MTEEPSTASIGTLALAAVFLTSGVLHFVRPRGFEKIVPRRLPWKRELVYLSGAAEIGCAGGLALPATRRLAGLMSAGLLVAVFPANVQMAVDILRRGSVPAKVLAIGRLPLQAPLVMTAWRAWRPRRRI